MEQAAQLRPGFVALAIRRRWRILVAGVLVGIALGSGAVLAAPTTYTSEARLYLNPIAGNPYQPDIGTSRSDQLVALQTEASLVSTPQVATLARDHSALTLPPEAEDAVEVTAPSNSQVLRVSFSAGRPDVAAAGAQAFAEGYLDYRRQRAEAANAAEAAQFQEQLDATSAVLDQTATLLAAAAPDSSNALLLQQQLQVYATQLAQLNLQLTEVQAAVPATGEVISPAIPATAPSGFSPVVVLVAAVAVMLSLAVVLALAREHADDRVHDPEELTGIGIGHPLAIVPTGEAAIHLQQVPPAGYRLLLTMIANRDTTGLPVVCVLGTHDPVAAMAVAAGLAASAQRLDRRTLLVGTPAPLQWSGAPVVALRDVASGVDPVPFPPATTPTIMRISADEVEVEQLVLSTALTDALHEARKVFDLVVVFGGEGTSAAGRRLAELADLTLVVAMLDHTEFGDVLALVQSLQQSGVEHLALVAARSAGSSAVQWSADGGGQPTGGSGGSSRRTATAAEAPPPTDPQVPGWSPRTGELTGRTTGDDAAADPAAHFSRRWSRRGRAEPAPVPARGLRAAPSDPSPGP